ncbi:fumarylacetoacetate hydrolase family protein [Streptomyces sp. NPDC057486]|uniref:fumarylacetoacetate hydrolase family protein n=1 Tax=Streptomyces sp. NPDC057486 TaxID=3346145 RepID=UPI0036B8D357
MKAADTVVGLYDPVRIPRGSVTTDWEVELAVVVGERARYLDSPENARRVIADYTISHDVSERAFQFELSPQWALGKSCETFNPLAPLPRYPRRCRRPASARPAAQRQRRPPAGRHHQGMIFGVDHILWYLSQYMFLEPGDVVSTRTPAGVAFGLPGTPYLRAGDTVEPEIDGRGTQRQIFVPAEAG